MSFPHPNFDHQALEMQIKKVIDSHGKHPESIDAETRELREREGGIFIKPHEIPWMQHMIIARMKELEKEIEGLRTSIESYSVPNLHNAEEKKSDLEKEYDYLRHNFAEKFFK